MKNELRFTEKENGKLGVQITFENSIYVSDTPIIIDIKEWNGQPGSYTSGYDKAEQSGKLFTATGMIETKYGSKIAVSDCYQCEGAEVTVSRKVKVIEVNGHECGFASSYGIGSSKNKILADYDAFIPGIWYRKNKNVVSHAFGSNIHELFHYIRITRMALPYVELFDEENHSFIAMRHLAPVPDTGFKETGEEWLVDESFQYASMGFKSAPNAELRYNFPGCEGEKNYVEGNRVWAKRSHPLRKGFYHEYSFSLMGGKADNAYEAMSRVWRYHYEKTPPKTVKTDFNKVYTDGIDLLNIYCQEYNGAMGIPFWATVPEGTVCDISYQMGFVGQQTMCAYHLLKYGYANEKQELIEKANKILDFWVKESTRTSLIPRVWYQVFPAAFKEDYPTYTRTAADGMEGVLVSYEISLKYGVEKPEWLAFCTEYGNWLVKNQNKDGSYYRAYNETGAPVHRGKFNTSNVIRFLINLYWLTGEEAYKAAALKAGEYCYLNIYQPMQFVGGTADNDNTIDKEAGMIAVYAFMTLYDLEGEEKWLKAAAGAADFCETWTYAWEYPVKPFKGNAVFDQAAITGLSLIATGHSHADVMMGYMPYEYFRLYLHTKDRHYYEFGNFINNNTKQTLDWSGSLKHVYPGLVEESGELAMQYHNGLGRWLPWCTIAEIESLTKLQDRFGDMDLEKLQ